MLAKIIFDRDELDADLSRLDAIYSMLHHLTIIVTCKDVKYTPPPQSMPLMQLVALLVGSIAPSIGAIPTLTFGILARNTQHQDQ